MASVPLKWGARSVPETIETPVSNRKISQLGYWMASGFVVLLLLLFHSTTWSMISIWLRSETFAHGFLILPISLWLIWNERDRLGQLIPQPAPWIAILLFPVGAVWLLASLVDVLVVQQLALVAMLILGVWCILGHQLARSLAFPLLFLFFAVPMGEALVPPMMEFTATSTVWLIQASGVPVYREGLYFALPSGNWSVVEACSGVRYIIASITLGVLYAYLTYRSFWRRCLFVLVSALLPVLANTARAYLIVMLGHLSDMTVATGVDHLIYGWAFFGLVMFVLFWIGGYFREDREPSFEQNRSVGQSANTSEPSPGLIKSAVIAIVAAAIWPLLAHASETRSTPTVALTLPTGTNNWASAPQVSTDWQPKSTARGYAAAAYQSDSQRLNVFVQYAEGFESDGDIVGSSRKFTVKDDEFRVAARGKANILLMDLPVTVDEAELLGRNSRLLAWSWYRVGGAYLSSDYIAKFREALASLGILESGSYRIVVALPIQSSIESARGELQQFLDEYAATLDEALRRAAVAGQ
jgi:exosortase A